ncbi:MAG: glycosyltransferase, partial [Christensenella sp.]
MKSLWKKINGLLQRILNKIRTSKEVLILKKSKYFNAKWYKKEYNLKHDNPYDHYLNIGWKIGYDPSSCFSTEYYLEENNDVKEAGINPLLHYEMFGRNEASRKSSNDIVKFYAASKYFDAKWYTAHYNVPKGISPEFHYYTIGWKKYNNPSADFSVVRYLIMNPDVRYSGIEPLEHYEKYGKYELQRKWYNQPLGVGITENKLKETRKIQDKRIVENYSRDTEKLIVYLVPDFDQICGGMMCICNYAHDIKGFAESKGFSRMVATIPSRNTFADYTKFDAHAHIYRFEQIRKHFPKLEKLIINIPEYQFVSFLMNISNDDLAWLSVSDFVTVNIMNQNNELVPKPWAVDILHAIVPNMTMTCAHRQYNNKYLRSTYKMPLHFIPADKKIKFKSVKFEDKEDLLVISPDEHASRDKIISKIEKAFPKIKIVVVENMAFSKYLDLIAKAKWVISFGEGFDGYTIESLYSNTISFTMFNDTFFEGSFERWPNMYEDARDMQEKIVQDMQRLNNKESYNKFLKEVQQCCIKEFDSHGYDECLQNYYEGNYDLPYENTKKLRDQVKSNAPLVTIALSTYQGQKYLKEQLDSLANQTYSNLEVLVYDRGSTDDTVKILTDYSNSIKMEIIQGTKDISQNGALEKLIGMAKGEFVALCDQDDIWLSDKIENLVNSIEDYDIAFGGVLGVDSKGVKQNSSKYYILNARNSSRWYQLKDVLQPMHTMPISAMLIRKEAAIKALPLGNESILLAWWLIISSIINGNGCIFSGKKVVYLRE